MGAELKITDSETIKLAESLAAARGESVEQTIRDAIGRVQAAMDADFERELAEKIAGICGFSGKISFDETKPDGTMQKLLDNSRLKDLCFDIEVGLDEGLEKTYNCFKR